MKRGRSKHASRRPNSRRSAAALDTQHFIDCVREFLGKEPLYSRNETYATETQRFMFWDAWGGDPRA